MHDFFNSAGDYSAPVIALLVMIWFYKEILLPWVKARGNGKSDRQYIQEIHAVVTAETSTGAKKAWFPSEPIAELRKSVEKIDTAMISRTHSNVNLVHEQIGEIIRMLESIRNEVRR